MAVHAEHEIWLVKTNVHGGNLSLFLKNIILNCVAALDMGNAVAASAALHHLSSAMSTAGDPLQRVAVAFSEALGCRALRMLPGLAWAVQFQVLPKPLQPRPIMPSWRLWRRTASCTSSTSAAPTRTSGSSCSAFLPSVLGAHHPCASASSTTSTTSSGAPPEHSPRRPCVCAFPSSSTPCDLTLITSLRPVLLSFVSTNKARARLW
jgi:hypothetical protein